MHNCNFLISNLTTLAEKLTNFASRNGYKYQQINPLI